MIWHPRAQGLSAPAALRRVARVVDKLLEMRCVALRLRMEEFFAAAQSLSQCHTSPLLVPECLCAFGTKGGRTVLFACLARLIDNTACHLAAVRISLLDPLCARVQMCNRVAFVC